MRQTRKTNEAYTVTTLGLPSSTWHYLPCGGKAVTTPCKTSRESEFIFSRKSTRYHFPLYVGNCSMHKQSILQSNSLVDDLKGKDDFSPKAPHPSSTTQSAPILQPLALSPPFASPHTP